MKPSPYHLLVVPSSIGSTIMFPDGEKVAEVWCRLLRPTQMHALATVMAHGPRLLAMLTDIARSPKSPTDPEYLAQIKAEIAAASMAIGPSKEATAAKVLAALKECANWIECELAGRLPVEPLAAARAAIAEAEGEPS